MKKRTILGTFFILAILVASSFAFVASAAETCTTTLTAGSDIQAAITAATSGDVICLDAGLYSPAAQIEINKSVTLQGPQAGVDPRPTAGTTRTPGDTSTEAIIDGTASGLSGIIVITADNVVLDGLEVRYGSGDMIDSESSIPTTGTVLKYNIIDNATGDEGIQLRNVTDGVIEYNYLYDIAQDGINMCCGSTGGFIRFNEVTDNNSENAAIYIYDATETRIECNLVYDVHGNDGIKLGDKRGGDASSAGGSILYNTVYNTAQDSISVYTSDTLVEGNEVYNSASENGAIYLAYGISNITITKNDLHNNTLNPGKWGDPGAVMIGTDVDASTVTVNNNNFSGNTVNGVTNKATALLIAESNWWGAADGPSGAGPGSGDAVSTKVDYDPWLSEAVVIPDPCAPNQPPVADANGPYLVAVYQSVALDGSGSTDPDGDDLNETWTVTGPLLGVITDSTFTAYEQVGITEVTLVVDDENGGTSSDTAMVVVYDPDGGFVTGGGWIDSPQGAYMLNDQDVEGLVFFNGFETDIFGWDAFGDPYDAIRVSSGTNSVTSASGDWHAEAGTAATNWGGYNSEFPDGGYITSVDIYLDVDAGFNNDIRYDWTSAINKPDGDHRRDFAFNGGFYNDDDGSTGSGTNRFIFSASNNTGRANSYPKNPGRNPIAISTTGWYTFLHRFYDDGTGILAVDLSILDISENLIHTWTLSDASDVIGVTVGGNRYGWFASNEFPFLAIDNSLRTGFVGPTGKANFGFVAKYDKKTKLPKGNTEFVFQAGDINFHSANYEWLLVNKNDSRAQFKGTGTINGEGEYKFMLWAGDTEPDTFRIKIWEETNGENVVYDNGFDGSGFENGQPIGGGNIVVHTSKK